MVPLLTPSKCSEEWYCLRKERETLPPVNLLSCPSARAAEILKQGNACHFQAQIEQEGAGSLWLHSPSPSFPSPVTFSLRVLCGILAEALCLLRSMILQWRSEGKTLPWTTPVPQKVVSGDMTRDASPTKAFRYQQTLVSTIPAEGQNISYIIAVPFSAKGAKCFLCLQISFPACIRKKLWKFCMSTCPRSAKRKREYILFFSLWN